jgi:hypothetical protein
VAVGAVAVAMACMVAPRERLVVTVDASASWCHAGTGA